MSRVIELQRTGTDDFESFDSTQDVEIHDTIYSGGYVLEEFENPDNVVLITAPHAQTQYRPTRWDSSYDPESGLYYCDSCNNPPLCNDASDFPHCTKPSDYCTGAMAKTLAEMVNAPVLYTRGRQEDPNYYDFPGHDFYSRQAQSNVGSGNVADPEMGFYTYGGIQTADFYNDYIGGNRIPFKQALYNYLSNHPEIKLIIDLHGHSRKYNI